MIEASSNRGQQHAYIGNSSNNQKQYEYNHPDDESLDQYLTVEDADLVETRNGQDYENDDLYYTETVPYDGRLSPTALNDDDDDDDDDDDGNESGRDYDPYAGKFGQNYRPPPSAPKVKEESRYYQQQQQQQRHHQQQQPPARPRTGRNKSYNTDSSHYLDDNNDDFI
jgi:hypothetical protein